MTRGQRLAHARIFRVLLPLLLIALGCALARRSTTHRELHAEAARAEAQP